MDNSYGSAAFKAHCLQILDEVAESRQPVFVTKRGKPVARLVPIEAAAATPLHGFLASTAHWTDDLFSAEEAWDADKA